MLFMKVFSSFTHSEPTIHLSPSSGQKFLAGNGTCWAPVCPLEDTHVYSAGAHAGHDVPRIIRHQSLCTASRRLTTCQLSRLEPGLTSHVTFGMIGRRKLRCRSNGNDLIKCSWGRLEDKCHNSLESLYIMCRHGDCVASVG